MGEGAGRNNLDPAVVRPCFGTPLDGVGAQKKRQDFRFKKTLVYSYCFQHLTQPLIHPPVLLHAHESGSWVKAPAARVAECRAVAQ